MGTKKDITLLQAMERIVELSKDSKLSKEFFRKVKAEVKLLADSYGITDQQAVLFCVCMEKGPHRVDYDDLANHLDVSKLSVLGYASDIDALVHRRLLKYRDVKDEEDFDVPIAVIRCLKHNEAYQLPVRKDLNCAELFELFDMWFDDLGSDAISPKELKEELKQLFEDNPQVEFVKELKSLKLSDSDMLMLVLFCHLLINNDDDDIRFGQMKDLFDGPADFNTAKSELRAGEHSLMRKKLIEHRCEDGIADTGRYRLTAEVRRSLLAEMKLDPVEEKLSGTLTPTYLTKKQLYYPKSVEAQVSRHESS